MRNNSRAALARAMAACCLFVASSSNAGNVEYSRYDVATEIGIARFGDPYRGKAASLGFSSDGTHFAAYTERGDVSANEVVSTLSVYRFSDVELLFDQHAPTREVPQVWTVEFRSKEAGAISQWKWVPDRALIAFLRLEKNGNRTLLLCDPLARTVVPLSEPGEFVRAFDIRDRDNYVYAVADQGGHAEQRDERDIAVFGSGRYLGDLLFPQVRSTEPTTRRSYLRAVIAGQRVTVKKDGERVALYSDQFALAPSSHLIVTDLPLLNVPAKWEHNYPPPHAGFPFRVRPGYQDPESPISITQFVLLDLESGMATPLTNAPLSSQAGWFAAGSPKWSRNGKSVILPGTFLEARNAPGVPCVAVVNVPSRLATCIEFLQPQPTSEASSDFHMVRDAMFVNGDATRAKVVRRHLGNSSVDEVEYRLDTAGRWNPSNEPLREETGLRNVRLELQESFQSPPRLVATNGKTSVVVWDPNPQLPSNDLTDVEVYSWTDDKGRQWTGGLYFPRGYARGRRYPLVVQTHGFDPARFEPSGSYPSGMAARALAETGIMVLQVNEDSCPSSTETEADCAVSGYEAAIRQLIAGKLIDETNIGIAGFSRTCMYVMHALTASSIRFKAAVITDGVMNSYLQYLLAVDGAEAVMSDAEGVIGAAPFGVGLDRWKARSPTFNLEKVDAPVLVTALGAVSALWMWEPYAGLRRLGKPVELLLVNTTEHVLTNPAARLASQGTTVEWFRFWLQGHANREGLPSPYERWQRFRDEAPRTRVFR